MQKNKKPKVRGLKQKKKSVRTFKLKNNRSKLKTNKKIERLKNLEFKKYQIPDRLPLYRKRAELRKKKQLVYQKKRYLLKREELINYQKDYNDLHRDRISAYKKEYYLKKKEELKLNREKKKKRD